MSMKEKELMMKAIKLNMIINVIMVVVMLVLLVKILGLDNKVVELDNKVEVLVQEVDSKKIQDIKALAGAITGGTIGAWSPSYVEDTYTFCVDSERLGVLEECKIIKSYLGE